MHGTRKDFDVVTREQILDMVETWVNRPQVRSVDIDQVDEGRERGGRWRHGVTSLVTEVDIGKLYDIIKALIKHRYVPDADGDRPIHWDLVDATTCIVPYIAKVRKGDAQAALRAAQEYARLSSDFIARSIADDRPVRDAAADDSADKIAPRVDTEHGYHRGFETESEWLDAVRRSTRAALGLDLEHITGGLRDNLERLAARMMDGPAPSRRPYVQAIRDRSNGGRIVKIQVRFTDRTHGDALILTVSPDGIVNDLDGSSEFDLTPFQRPSFVKWTDLSGRVDPA